MSGDAGERGEATPRRSGPGGPRETRHSDKPVRRPAAEPGHRRVATVDAPTPAEAAGLLAGCTGLADLVEVRLDAWWSDVPAEDDAVEALVTVLDAAARAEVPLLATLRPVRQGGRFDGPENVRVGLLIAAARAGFDAVDLEDDHEAVGALCKLLVDEGAEVVLSDHRFRKAPDRETGLRHLQSMQDLHGALHKIAYPATALPDVLRALELTHAHVHRHGRPAVTPHGNADAPVRALLAVAGNHATYGHAPGAPPAVRGQPGLADVQAAWHHWGLGREDLGARPGGSPWLAVLGDPVAHSLSPRVHNAALRAAGRPERFGALRIPDSLPSMRLVATVAARLGMRGASVTSPLKHHAAMVATGDESVQATSAANCLRFVPGGAEATNTDASAARRLLSEHLDPGDTVGVLGAGGAARSIVHAAHTLDLDVTVCARDPDAYVLGARVVPWEKRGDLRAEAWVQATTLGMTEGDEPALPGGPNGARLAVELVYARGPTPFQQTAEAAGATVLDGRRFLLEQAVDAYRYWTGAEPDRDLMEAALS